MSIRKTRNGKSWMYDMRTPDKKRIRKSGFKTREAAERAVASLKAKWYRQKLNLSVNGADRSTKIYSMKGESQFTVKIRDKSHNLLAVYKGEILIGDLILKFSK